MVVRDAAGDAMRDIVGAPAAQRANLQLSVHVTSRRALSVTAIQGLGDCFRLRLAGPLLDSVRQLAPATPQLWLGFRRRGVGPSHNVDLLTHGAAIDPEQVDVS